MSVSVGFKNQSTIDSIESGILRIIELSGAEVLAGAFRS